MTIVQSASQTTVPVTEVVIGDGVTPEISVESMRMTEEAGQHQEVTLTALWPVLDPSRYKDETISFLWGQKRVRFDGYINRITKDQGFQAQPLVTISCIGASWPLSDGAPRFWAQKTTSEIVQSLCEPHGIGTDLDDHEYVWPVVAQTSESDWGMIKKLAGKIGYIAFVHDGVVRVMDPRKVFETAPLYHLEKSTHLFTSEQLLLDWTPTDTSSDDRTIAKPKLGWFGGDNEVKFVNPDADDFATGLYIDTSAKAQLIEGYLESSTEFWQQTASARIRGGTINTPGVTVNVVTGLTGSARDVNDGLWFVKGVVHDLDRRTFQTSLKLIRDKDRGYAASDSTFRGFNYYRSSRPTPKLYRVNGRWVSSWR